MNELTRAEIAHPKSEPGLAECIRTWLRIGLLSFGGPAAQIALMHREIVENKNWLSEQEYLNALSFCMLLPGPEAMQIATYSGWRLHGTLGGLIAGLLFVAPGAMVILGLAMVYVFMGELAIVHSIFLGIKAAVIVIVIEALIKVSKRALQQTIHWVIAALAFLGIFFLALPFPLIIALAALWGFFRVNVSQQEHHTLKPKIPIYKSVITILSWMAIWWTPLILLAMFSDETLLVEIGIFFSKLAVVTFGGAYAVLAYLGQDVVDQFGWLTATQMVDGLGLAETTPGPLILVNEFVGFLAAFRAGGTGYGILGAMVTLWVTFVPCFLWIFAGAPYIDWISSQSRLRGALSAITAAVVGVILNLSIWFSLHVFFHQISAEKLGPLVIWKPEFASLDYTAVALSLLCAILMFRFSWGISRTLLCAAAAGVLLSYNFY